MSLRVQGGVAGVVLAAGASRRFGPTNKLLLDIGGETLVHRTVRVLREAKLSPLILVLGRDHEAIARAIADLSPKPVVNPAPEQGMSKSIGLGIAALPESVEAVVLAVADQACLTTATITAVAARFRATRAPIVAARYAGQLATPVLFHRSLFPQLMKLTGDRGAASIVRSLEPEVEWVDLAAELAVDIDTPADLAAIQGKP